MLTAIKKSVITITIISMIALAGQSTAANDPSKRYKHDGIIFSIDKIKRLLNINGKMYKAAVGIKLENLPKKQRYSGLKFLYKDLNIFFDLQRGTENKKTPTITKIWVIAN